MTNVVKCSRAKQSPHSHYRVNSVGENGMARVTPGADSFAPGFDTFVKADDLMICGCGQWGEATNEEYEAAAKRIVHAMHAEHAETAKPHSGKEGLTIRCSTHGESEAVMICRHVGDMWDTEAVLSLQGEHEMLCLVCKPCNAALLEPTHRRVNRIVRACLALVCSDCAEARYDWYQRNGKLLFPNGEIVSPWPEPD
jgi:hypothetical protein